MFRYKSKTVRNGAEQHFGNFYPIGAVWGGHESFQLVPADDWWRPVVNRLRLTVQNTDRYVSE